MLNFETFTILLKKANNITDLTQMRSVLLSSERERELSEGNVTQ